MEKNVGQGNGAAVATRICRKPDCTVELGPLNKSGLCSKHFHWSDPAKRRSTAGNGHAAAQAHEAEGGCRDDHEDLGVHADPKAANGNGRVESIEVAGDFVEDRVNWLLLSMPAATKTQIATAWLKGAL